jgi:hypothetical protein
VLHKALTSVLSLAELAAEDLKLGGALLSKEHTLYLSFLGPNNPSLSSPKFGMRYSNIKLLTFLCAGTD